MSRYRPASASFFANCSDGRTKEVGTTHRNMSTQIMADDGDSCVSVFCVASVPQMAGLGI